MSSSSSEEETNSSFSFQTEIELTRMNKSSQKINNLQNKISIEKSRHQQALNNYINWSRTNMDQLRVDSSYFGLRNMMFEEVEAIGRMVEVYEVELENEKESYSLAKESLELMSNYIHLERRNSQKTVPSEES